MESNEFQTYAKELTEKLFDGIVNNNKLLSDRFKTIYIMSYVDNISHDEIGKELGLDRSRISQILRKYTPRLQQRLNDLGLNND